MNFLHQKLDRIQRKRDMVLLMEYFQSDNAGRLGEHLTCLEENILNNIISKIVLFISDDSVCLINSKKIEIKYLNNRPTYDDIFKICNKEYSNEICIVSNADIMFDDSLRYINNVNINNRFIALNRWDLNEDGSLIRFRHDIGDSQDCWIFKSPVNIKNADFTMGKLGCDSRIAYLAFEVGMDVINPSEQIITKHLHNTKSRTVSADQKQSVFGMHLIVPAIDSIDHEQPLIERDWPRR